MKNDKPIRIIVADDHGLFRSGIIEILKSNENFILAGEAENGAALVDLYLKERPDVAIVDISMPIMSGIEALKKIKETDPLVKALFLSMYDSEEYVYAVITTGGLGLINKNIQKNELFEGIIAVSKGERFFNNLTSQQIDTIIEKFSDNNVAVPVSYENLTPSEKKIIKYISEGLTSLEMAKKLGLSKRTIDTHRTHLVRKLNLRSLPDLIKFAIQYTLIKQKE